MKKRIPIAILSLIILLMIVGCPPSEKPADTPDPPQVDTPENPQSENPATDPGSADEPGPTDTTFDEKIDNRTVEILAMLGYDPDDLEITEKNPMGEPEAVNWRVTVEDSLGPLFDVVIDEAELKVLMIRAGRLIDENSPAPLQPGADLPDRIAAAMDLAGEGYRKFETPEPTLTIFRKFIPLGDFEVNTGECAIITGKETNSLEGVNWFELEIPANSVINITKDQAVGIAVDFLKDPAATPVQSTLKTHQTGPSLVNDVLIVWEIKFDQTVVFVQADDGSVVQ